MKIVHIAAGLWEHTGGPAEVIPELCTSLVEKGCEVTLLTVDGKHSESTLLSAKKGVNVVSFPAISNTPMRYSPGMSSYLRQNVGSYDIVHNHGHWLHPNWAACKYAKLAKKPLVTTPHGTLVPGMLSHSPFKKMFSWHFFDKRLVSYAKIIHALSPIEAEDMVPRLGETISKKVVVVSNGVESWDLSRKKNGLTNYPALMEKNVILFLSRVHPIKGIFDLLETWKAISGDYKDWHLLVVGPIEGKIKPKLDKMVLENGLIESTTIAGPIYGKARQDAFALAKVFVLPSYGEGLPTALLEALSCGIPVICTDECNFYEAAKVGAALSGPAGQKALISNFKRMLSLSEKERTEMGEKGKTLVQEHYSWGSIAEKWVQIYNSLLP